MRGGPPERAVPTAISSGHEPGTPEYDEAWRETLPSFEAQVERDRETVVKAGGLLVLGTARHESRRADDRLRALSGRRGEPGESRFYLSLEDDLVRLFARDRINRILEKLGPAAEEREEQPIEAEVLSGQFDHAQERVEEHNLLRRRQLLAFDIPDCRQRETINEYRDRILAGEDMSGEARARLPEVIERVAGEHLAGDLPEDWDLDGLRRRLASLSPCSYTLEDVDSSTVNREAFTQALRADLLRAYEKREREFGEERMRALERSKLLQSVDERWREHLHDMEHLRERIHLRGFAQVDPLVAYEDEGSSMFTALMTDVWEDFARHIFNVDVSSG